jgi:hypothetical protein
MPLGVRLLLLFGFGLLAFLGLTLPVIVAQAVEAPVTGIGLLWMLLLAYVVFTLTLVWQRKEAAFRLSLGLATLTIPLVPLLAVIAGLPGAILALALCLAVFWGLLRPDVRGWFVEP